MRGEKEQICAPDSEPEVVVVARVPVVVAEPPRVPEVPDVPVSRVLRVPARPLLPLLEEKEPLCEVAWPAQQQAKGDQTCREIKRDFDRRSKAFLYGRHVR